ncbi:hypothetical protein ACI8AC_05535 [Geodermatophilus sp. SYSU D00758]
MSQPTTATPDATPSTQAITVGTAPHATAQLPPVPAEAAPAPRPSADPEPGVQPTGPVGFVPGLPGAGTAAPTPAPAAARRSPRTPEQRAGLRCAGLAGVSLALLQAGLLVGADGTALWSAVPLWSAFATIGTLLGLLPAAGRLVRRARLDPGTAWQVAAGGLTGVAVFWVLVVLPGVASDRGFVLTAALVALGAALWTAPARRG